MLLPLLAWAHLATGNEAHAEELVARAIHQARDEQNNVALVDALRIQALVLAQLGCGQAPLDALDEALALCRSMGYLYAEVKVQYVAALVCPHLDVPTVARRALDSTVALCGQLGERLYAERAERLAAGGA